MTDKTAPKTAPRATHKNVIEFPKNRTTPPAGTRPLSGSQVIMQELTSINALTAYVAHNKNVPEDVVRTYLHTEFNVPDAGELRREIDERKSQTRRQLTVRRIGVGESDDEFRCPGQDALQVDLRRR